MEAALVIAPSLAALGVGDLACVVDSLLDAFEVLDAAVLALVDDIVAVVHEAGSEGSDDSDLAGLADGEGLAGVLEEDDGLSVQLSGQVLEFLRVDRLVPLLALEHSQWVFEEAELELGAKEARHGFIDYGNVERAAGHHVWNHTVVEAAAAHLDIVAGRQALVDYALCVLHGAGAEVGEESVGAACVGHDEVLVTPLFAEDLGQCVVVGNRGNAVVAMVGGHDRVGVGVDDGALEGRKPGGAQLALAAVDGSGVDALLGGGETGKVLHHGGHVLGLQAHDEVITDFAGEVLVFTVGLFHAAEAEFTGQIDDGGEHLVGTQGGGLDSDDLGHAAGEVAVECAGEGDGRVEDSGVADEEAVDGFSLDESWNAEGRVVGQVVLSHFDTLCEEVP